jgi:hypothetical protein
MAYILLDTNTNIIWQYKKAVNNAWTRVGGSISSGVTGVLPVENGGTGITSLGTGVATFLGTPSSANLASAVTNETGSGNLVFATQPVFTNTIGVGAATASTSGSGITFPATQSASTNLRTLDDYEEGTFTANYSTTGTAFSSITHDITIGTYTKIGNLVYISIAIRTSALSIGSASGLIGISLPFSSKPGLDGFSGSVSFAFNFNVNHPITCSVSGNLLYLQYRSTSNGSGNFLEPVDLATGASKNYAYITTSYIAN